MANRKLISFSNAYKDVWEKLEEFARDGSNVSEYVCQAIRFYLEHGDKHRGDISEDRIRAICIEEINKRISSLGAIEDVLTLDSLVSSQATTSAFDSFNTNINKL